MTEPTVSRVPIPALAHHINVAAIAIGLLDIVLVATHVHSPVRTIATLFVFLLGPGSGLTQFLRLSDRALQFGVVVALSIAIDLLVSQALLSAHNIDAAAGVLILVGISLIRPPFTPNLVVKMGRRTYD